MKYVFLLFISISLLFSVQLYSKATDSDPQKISDNFNIGDISGQNLPDSLWKPCISPFIELLGKGFISLNVDFRKKESYAISFGIQPFEGILPNIMYYHFFGKRHRIELGGGLSGGLSKDFNLAVILIHGDIGYRYQKKKGLFFRVGFTPLYIILLDDPDRSNKLYPFGGLSLGYSF